MTYKRAAALAGAVSKGLVSNLKIRNMSSRKLQVYVTRSDMPECGIEILKKQ